MIPGRVALMSSLLIGILLCVNGPSTGIQARAEVKGTITDATGAGIVSASVAFAREGQSLTVRTDSYGAYRVLLEPGIYEVSVKASGFYEMRRGAFTLQEGDEADFDFELLTAVISDPVVLGGNESSQPHNLVHHDRYNYQEESLKAIRGGLEPLVLFGHREEKPGSVRYVGLVRDGKMLPVVFTYDLLTVKSQELTYFRRDSSIEGVGNVVFKNRKNIEHGSKIEISFRNGKPEITLK